MASRECRATFAGLVGVPPQWHTGGRSGSRRTPQQRPLRATRRLDEGAPHEARHPPRVRRDPGRPAPAATRSPPAAPPRAAAIHVEVCSAATRSTRASRRSSTPAAASPGSRSASARRPTPPTASRPAGRRPVSRGRDGAVRRQVTAPDRTQVIALDAGADRVRGRRRPASPSTPTWRRGWPTRPSTPTRARPAGSAAATPQLGPVVAAYRDVARRWRTTWRRPASWPARTPSFAAEVRDARRAPRRAAEDGCATCWCPRDPDDDRDVILEVKAGEGGEESALFAGDLLRMYLRYAERQGWKTEVLDAERVRPRWLQGRRGRGEGRGATEPGEAPGPG